MKHSAIDMYILSKVIGKDHFKFADIFFGTHKFTTEELEASIDRLENSGFIEFSDLHHALGEKVWLVKDQKDIRRSPIVGLSVLTIAIIIFVVIRCLM